ncbi:MAG: (Fe-S)-binding protein [Chloroflexi bacterium]|nr:(Fe-S)-binding protein [Chloroflexota bacterium]
MLTDPERILFLLASLATALFIVQSTHKIVKIIGRGNGKPDWNLLPRRLIGVLAKTLSFSTVFRARKLTSLMHAFVAWGFIYYLLVNFGDVLRGYIPDYEFLGSGMIGNLGRLAADFFSVLVLVGMLSLLFRRFIVRPTSLEIRQDTLLHPKARKGIRRDSLIVGAFILFHVGARLLGESFQIAITGSDIWQPFASTVARLWGFWQEGSLNLARHLSWWGALGAIMLFFPYFPRSKHLHLFMAPINFLLQPERRSMGELSALDFEDSSIEQFGAQRLEDLSWSGIMDAYACIMCNRCQDACPAYETGKVLSPAALEINKRYFINQESSRLAKGEQSSETLLDFAITPEAVWACTACGACIEVCPVGIEPMRDILEIRRHLVLTENVFPEQLQVAFRGMERAANPWNIAPDQRLNWAEGLNIPTIDQNPDADILWWVGCAPATDARAQKTASAFAKILENAGVNYAVLGTQERCTGDSARRAGNEYIFNELATQNVKTLNKLSQKRIVTTCPHCLHTLSNEYPDFGGNYEVIHHSQLIEELLDSNALKVSNDTDKDTITFHDPCYLGRQNNIVNSPRASLLNVGLELQELPRSGVDSFCCGAGGGQMWKEEEQGESRVSAERMREIESLGVSEVAVGCPFCMIMLTDAAGSAGNTINVKDIAEIVAERLEENVEGPPLSQQK